MISVQPMSRVRALYLDRQGAKEHWRKLMQRRVIHGIITLQGHFRGFLIRTRLQARLKQSADSKTGKVGGLC